jgi:outer membrane protein assembly factor BamA
MGNPGYSTYFGFQGSAQMLFSDVLGDHQIYVIANLFQTLRNSNIYAAYHYLPYQWDYNFSVYHNSAYFSKYVGSGVRYFSYRNWGVGTGASYPFDRFNRFEANLSVMNLSKVDNLLSESVHRTLLVPSVKYVHDDVMYGYYGPVKGSRYNFGIKAVPRFYDQGSEFITFSTDYRKYFRISDFMSFAIRATGAKSIGSKPQNFYLGGTDNWINRTFQGSYLPIDEPEDYAFMEFVLPLRGVDLAEIQGSQYFLLNAEFRFPMFQAIIAGPLPLFFQAIMGAVFLDVGGAWSGDFSDFQSTIKDSQGRDIPYNLVTSTGIGMRSYFFGIPLKLDIAWQYLYHTWSQPKYMVSLGYDF